MSNNMFLWRCLLLFPMIIAVEVGVQINNYVINMSYMDETFILESVKFIEAPSEKLNLTGLRLGKINDNAFENVMNIKVLDLSNNSFFRLSENTFTNLTNLENLYLSHNKLSRLGKLFVGLSNLKFLDLSRTMIKSLESSDFFGLTKSCVILLRNTTIANISNGVFENELRRRSYFDEDDTHYFIQNTQDSRSRIKTCMNDHKLISVEHYTEGEQLASGCNTDRSYANGVLNLEILRIAEFQRGWYKLGDKSIYKISLRINSFTRLTSEMLNDLPESIRIVDLSSNNVERLEKGIIVNEYLQEMHFSFCSIIEIKDNVFANTNLTTLALSYNRLTDTKFAATLPPTLTKIELNQNKIAEISRESFSKLNKLEVLGLSDNFITEIHRDSFRDLSSLKNLNLEYNKLKKIKADSFKDLAVLEVLHLKKNVISELPLGIFADLKNIKHIYLGSNRLFKLTRGSLFDWPGSLEVLDLQHNALENLKAGTFVNSPKYKLLLNNNYISNIEVGSFNLPHLKYLQLGDNLLTVVDNGQFQNLHNLRKLRLYGNNIARIEKGVFENLENLCELDLSKNPIKTLENGTLHGLLQEEGCYVTLMGVPIEMIHGGVFASSLEFSSDR